MTRKLTYSKESIIVNRHIGYIIFWKWFHDTFFQVFKIMKDPLLKSCCNIIGNDVIIITKHNFLQINWYSWKKTWKNAIETAHFINFIG